MKKKEKGQEKDKRKGSASVVPKLLIEFIGWFAAIMILTTWLNK